VREGDAGQRLVQQHLVVRRLAAAGVRRLAERADRAGVLVEDVPPERDQPRGVAPGNGHVGEADVVPQRSEGVAQHGDPLRWQHGHDGFPRRQPLPYEPGRALHELLVRRVDEGVVLEPGRRTMGGIGGAVLQHPHSLGPVRQLGAVF